MPLLRRAAHRPRIVVTLVCSLLASACLVASVQRAAAATWTTIVNQTFESIFPPTDASWKVND